MRQCINGAGADTAAAVQSYLNGTSSPLIRHLYLIGNPENPQAIRFTDHEGPVIYTPWGTFAPAVVTRGGVTAKIGLEVQKLNVTWAPGNRGFTSAVSSASPLQLARLHYYDNWQVRIWKVFMPAPGDANTLGGCEWFGGRVGSSTVGRNGIKFSVSSFLDVVTQKLPATVIESTSTLASYTAATQPPGDGAVPVFMTYAGSAANSIIADCVTPVYRKIYGYNFFAGGYMVFMSGAGATLAGVWSAILGNAAYEDGDGNSHSSFTLYNPLPWAPTPGVQFYVSKAAPINQADGDYYGFNYVPAPTTAA